jgi:flagellar basal body rod protein FlgG
MNYGLYVSASGVLANTHRQDVFANNLANVETFGFKPDMPSIRQRDAEAVEEQLGPNYANELLDRLGGGVLVGTPRINFDPGALRQTKEPLDVALQQRDQFFAVEVRNPDTGATEVALTRDGRFNRNAAGELVTKSGHRVLDASDRPIVINGNGQASIGRSGEVLVNGDPAGARVQVSRVADLDGLTKRGFGLFAFTGADTRQPIPESDLELETGHVEASGVDPIMAMMDVVAATKAITSNANMIRYHDQILDRAVNTLGRVG